MTVVKSEPVINTTSPSPSWILDHLRRVLKWRSRNWAPGPPPTP